MTQRRLLLGLCLLIAVAVVSVFVIPWATSPNLHINASTLAKVRVGMTEAEVSELLGGPAGDYTRGRCVPAWEDNGRNQPSGKQWVGRDAALFVGFDERGLVTTTALLPVFVIDESLFDRLRRWVRL